MYLQYYGHLNVQEFWRTEFSTRYIYEVSFEHQESVEVIVLFYIIEAPPRN